MSMSRKSAMMTPDEVSEKQALYDEITADATIQEQIDAIFTALDANGDGSLDKDELKDLVSAYDGRPFDEQAFFRFYDVHGLAGGVLGPHEFCWYVADWACTISESDDPNDAAAAKEALPSVIKDLQEIVNIYIKKPPADAPAQ